MIHDDLKGMIWIDERLQNPALPDFSLRLFGELVRRSWGNGETWITSKSIAEALGRDRKIVERHIYKLETLGMIARRVRTQSGARTTYFIKPLPPEKWTLPEVQNTPRPRCKTHHARGAKRTTGTFENNKEESNKEKGPEPAPIFGFMDAASQQTQEAPTDCRDWEYLRDPIPADWIADPEFRTLWFSWLENRRKHKARVSEKGLDISRGRLAAWQPDLTGAKDMLERAIQGGWQGLFKPDPSKRGPAAADSAVQIPEGM